MAEPTDRERELRIARQIAILSDDCRVHGLKGWAEDLDHWLHQHGMDAEILRRPTPLRGGT